MAELPILKFMTLRSQQQRGSAALTAPKSAFDWLRGFALGLLIGVIALCIVLWALDSAPTSQFHNYIIAALTVGGTLLAALIALRSVQVQVFSAIALADSTRQRELRASAAFLPLALSKIVETCEHNIRRHFEKGQLRGEGKEYGGTLRLIDESALQAIRDCIVHVDDASHVHLLYVFRAYQVLLARDRSSEEMFLIPEGATDTNYDFETRAGDAVNWAVLHAAAVGMFPFARGEASVIRSYNPDEVRNAFPQAGLFLEANPLIERKLEARLKDDRLGLKFVSSEASGPARK